MSATLPAVQIVRRFDACSCGCQGSDPWHARTFTRTVFGVRDARGTANVHAYSAPVAISREGWARLPWGEGKPVRVVEVVLAHDGRRLALGWFSTSEG